MVRIPKEAWTILASLLLEVWRFFKNRKKKGNCDDKT